MNQNFEADQAVVHIGLNNKMLLQNDYEFLYITYKTLPIQQLHIHQLLVLVHKCSFTY